MDRGLQDLKKAVSPVDHALLLAKLQLYGITDSALNLFKSYFAFYFSERL